MTETRPRGDPFDGLNGLFAAGVVVSIWWALTGERGAVDQLNQLPANLSLDGFLMITGLMSARAARHSLMSWAEYPRYVFWRGMRILPALAASLGIYLLMSALLFDAGLGTVLSGGAAYFAVNPLTPLIATIFLGSVLYGAVFAAGMLNGAIGRSGVAALIAALILSRIAPGVELTPTMDMISRLCAAFALGVFLENINVSGRFARAMRRLKAANGALWEISALALLICVAALTTIFQTFSVFAPLVMMSCLMIFTRRYEWVSDSLLSAWPLRKLSLWAIPILCFSFTLIWPVRELRVAGILSEMEVIIFSPLYLLSLVAFSFALQHLIEDPVRTFAKRCHEAVRTARKELAMGKM